MKLRHAALTITAAVSTAAISFYSAGCSTSDDRSFGSSGTKGNPGPQGGNSAGGAASTAGTTGSGSGGTTGGAACTNVTGCGGNVVGEWTVASSCLKISGNLDVTLAGLDPNACVMPTANGSLTVTGALKMKADGSYLDETTTTGTVQIGLPAGCLNLSGTKVNCDGVSLPLGGVGFETVQCVPASDGGCTCTGNVNHMGSAGLITPNPQTDGFYKAAGNDLTLALNFADSPYTYCSSGNQLTISPRTNNPLTTGSIVLSGGGSVGTGGTTGAGGSTSGPGGSGSGGAKAQGGSTSAGGASSGGSPGTGGGGTTNPDQGPCDIYAAANTPCAAAYSMVRRLNSKYTGPLYKVRAGSSAMNTGSGGTGTKDIGVTAQGFADTAALEAFCSGTICTVALLYDQSGNGNDLPVAKKGLSAGGTYSASDDFESSATKGMLNVGGHKIYPLYMAAREGYRLAKVGKGMPTGTMSQGIYELADGNHVGTACCWDFGNVTTDPTKYGFMNTLFFGMAFWGKGAGSGPWMMADFEGGVWAGGAKKGDPGWGALSDDHPPNTMNPSLKVPFAFGISKTTASKWTLRMANLQSATELTTAYDGGMPISNPSNLGGIVLGVGGDNSNNSWGTFYEGAIVSGLPTSDVDLAVMKNVQAVGYGK